MAKKNKNLPYKGEIGGIILTAVFLIITLSLFSYNPTDKSYFHISTNDHIISNWLGIIGAQIAALFFYFFGSAAYIIGFSGLFLAYILLTKKSLEFETDRMFALLSFLFASTTFLKAYNLDFTKSYPGGLLGEKLFNFLSNFFGFWGTNILFLTTFWVSTVIFFRVPFLTAFYKTIKFFYSIFRIIFTWIFHFAHIIFQKFVLEKIELAKKRQNEPIKKDLGNTGNGESNDDFWQSLNNLTKEKEPINTISVEIENKIPTSFLENKFSHKKIFKTSHKLDFNFLMLPNSCLSKNLFSEDFYKKVELLKKRFSEKILPRIEYNLPDLKMFEREKTEEDKGLNNFEKECVKQSEKLEEKLSYFGIKGEVTAIRPGPVITLFEYKPKIDSKISKIVSLEDDLAMALTAVSIRIVAPIPGRNVIGFEIANPKRKNVYISDIFLEKEFREFKGKLPLNLGVDIVGKPVIEDLIKMPHLLVAGSTGSGKSVGLNAILAGLLCKLTPTDLKLILVDPKRLEFSPYADIPHLLFPIITNPRKAAPVLKWLVQEMEQRYEKMAKSGVRNIVDYQKLLQNDEHLEPMPFIILMIDELADLMMVAGKEVEIQIARIAQMARAAGIHMIVATQRPSVDVVTGLIKVNFPSRIAYRVTSKVDSRTIIDGQGAEKLLGMGDLLFMTSSSADLKRIHGAYISEKEILELTSFLRNQGAPEYLDLNEVVKNVNIIDSEIDDELYPQIIDFLKDKEEISISLLQRYYKIGFNRSAKIIEKLELDGLIAPAQGSKPRKVIRP